MTTMTPERLAELRNAVERVIGFNDTYNTWKFNDAFSPETCLTLINALEAARREYDAVVAERDAAKAEGMHWEADVWRGFIMMSEAVQAEWAKRGGGEFSADDAGSLMAELVAERDAAQRWARAWKALCKRISRESNASQSKTLRLITKENPRSAEVAYTGLMLMAAFANDQGDDESVEECAFRVVAERDRLKRDLNECEYSLAKVAEALGHITGRGMAFWDTAEQVVTERDDAQAERERLKAQVSAMREAMGEEWVLDEQNIPRCAECHLMQVQGHFGWCSRGRFFAALAKATP